MPGFTMTDIADTDRTLGKVAIFYTASAWDGATDLQDSLVHLGDTEGDVTITINDEYSDLIVDESTGPAIHVRKFKGASPTVEFDIYLVDPALRAILSPVGSGSLGRGRWSSVTEHSLVLIPESILINTDDTLKAVDYTTAGGWTFDAGAADATELDGIDKSLWCWRGHFSYGGYKWHPGDGGKEVDTVTFQVMQCSLSTSVVPTGQRLITLGDPADSAIDISPSG